MIVLDIRTGELTEAPDPPPPTLAQVKAFVIEELGFAHRKALSELTVTIGGKTYAATPEQLGMVGALARRSAAGRPLPASIRDTSGTAVPLTVALIGQLDDAMSDAVQARRDNYWAKYDAVQAAATVTAARAITY